MASNVRHEIFSFLEKISKMYGPITSSCGSVYVVVDSLREPFSVIANKCLRFSREGLKLNLDLATRKIVWMSLERILFHKDYLWEDEQEYFNELEGCSREYTADRFLCDFKREVSKEDVENGCGEKMGSVFKVRKEFFMDEAMKKKFSEVSIFPFEGILNFQEVQIDTWGNPFLKYRMAVVYINEFSEDFVKHMNAFLVEIVPENNLSAYAFENNKKLKDITLEIVIKIKNLLFYGDGLRKGGIMNRLYYALFADEIPTIRKDLMKIEKILLNLNDGPW